MSGKHIAIESAYISRLKTYIFVIKRGTALSAAPNLV